jgi:hypothetical protein
LPIFVVSLLAYGKFSHAFVWLVPVEPEGNFRDAGEESIITHQYSVHHLWFRKSDGADNGIFYDDDDHDYF